MTDFFRVSGGGNDFLALIEPAAPPSPEEIRAWCTRGLSLGADGLFTLSRQSGRVKMAYFNSDGLPADLCLNGTRCAARLAFHLGWAEDETEIETGAGTLPARRQGETRVAVELPTVGQPAREITLEDGGRLWEGFLVMAGVPHLVLPTTEDLAEAPMAEAPRLRRHPAFGAAGTNVDFVRYTDLHRFEIRSFERGVEAETLACGTGVMAATVVGLLIRRSALPVVALTRGGFELTVEGEGPAHQLPDRWSLAGDARILAHGTLTPEAAQLQPRPAW